MTMVSKTYTARELLRLRHASIDSELEGRLYSKLMPNLDLSDILRMPHERPLSVVTEESPDMSHSSDRQHAQRGAPAPQLDGAESEWKYRGRTDSENIESQPISAPAGPMAQKSEGFQRFYKAVVSPTHVRVTAGGRIVPNTRGSASPTSRLGKERPPLNVHDTSGDRSIAGAQPEIISHPIAQPPFGGYGPMLPGFAAPMPLHPTMVHRSHPHYPIMPLPVGFNLAGGYTIPPPTLGHLPTKITAQQSNSSSQSDKHSEVGGSEKGNQVHISPPEQFDQSRPFFYNGQWIIPHSGNLYPYGIMPLAGFPTKSISGHFMDNPSSNGATFAGQQSSSTEMRQSNPTQPAVGIPANSSAPSNPPISSIRPSEITKKQIETLRHSLRYFEDQLQYNKHQIDEKSVEQQAQVIRQQIDQFKKTLEGQLVFENSNYPKVDNGAESKNAANHKSAVPIPTPASDRATQQNPKKTGRDASSARSSTGLNSTKSVAAFPPVQFSLAQPADMHLFRKASSLPINAALAPPFQPRNDINTSTDTEVSQDSFAPSSDSTGCQARMEQFVPRGHPGWKTFFKYPPGSVDLGTPYLVGEVPKGIRPEAMVDSDYIYNRDLTEDELRARHMYWGNTPRHLQKGLPKFDGKDFYPPSPVKERTAESSQAGSTGSLLMSGSSVSDPFEAVTRSKPGLPRSHMGNTTQSEALPCSEQTSIGMSAAWVPRSGSCATRVGSVDKLRPEASNMTDTSSRNSNCKARSSDEADDDKGLLFKGRRAMERSAGPKAQNHILHSVLKSSKTSGNAVPSKVTSMTAQGVLPNYAGHAAASLSPAIANTIPSSRVSAKKVDDIAETATVALSHAGAENRPPIGAQVDESRRVGTQADQNHRGKISA